MKRQSLARRDLIRTTSAAVLGAGVAACGGGHAEAASRSVFVLVHGAWHNASTWNQVIPHLAQLGHAAVAVDLPGHGLRASFPASWRQRPFNEQAFAAERSPVAGITLDDYVVHVLDVIEQVRNLGNGQVILVGHSLGGGTITLAGERAAGKISKLVYLTAFLPFNGKSLLDTAIVPEGASNEVPGLTVGDLAVSGAQRIDFASPDPAYQAKIKSAFYADVSDQAFVAMGNLLTPDEPIGPALVPITRTARGWGAIDRHYIKCLRDNAVVPPLAQLMISTADQEFPQRRTVVHTMDTSHSPFLSAPAELARLLASIALG
ncbi:alpha/beta hydrolase [Variovorax sp. LT1R16]|uniref:alpha/beta hydrolase n=1 Tax=Variovorax sp. LT1R16 TaxID=3443728 RepID=UPI003F44F92F